MNINTINMNLSSQAAILKMAWMLDFSSGPLGQNKFSFYIEDLKYDTKSSSHDICNVNI